MCTLEVCKNQQMLFAAVAYIAYVPIPEALLTSKLGRP
jgi:hypothetical protein